ncbi:MAG: 3-dehydroquinate synthase [Gemmatimonadales bacterium]|nr:3-dehydroquinate synthase [Gemmatimonadales bacterium]
MTSIRVPIHETRDASYDVIVGRGALAELPALLRDRCPAHAYAVIADKHVADLHAAALLARLKEAGLEARIFTFAAGEWNKTRETWSALTDALLAARIGRDGAVIALGGGVAGDLAGFVAATFLRGIPYVQVPTSLLAMIDSSVGGKSGVDVPAGKNLVGAFHQPRGVVADIDLLATLPRHQLASGMAEAIKHGVIADAGYAASLADAERVLARDLSVLEPIVRRSVEIKAGVVADDEREAGRRQVLNFGHTIGHAVEAKSGFDLLHGEAVAIGMVAEAWIAETSGVAEPGLRAELAAMLERYALPTTIPAALRADDLLEAMSGDKKVRAGRLRFTLPRKVGEIAQSADGEWTVRIGEDVVRSAIDACR